MRHCAAAFEPFLDREGLTGMLTRNGQLQVYESRAEYEASKPFWEISRREGIDWTLAFVAGLVGSFVGGLLFSLIAGDGLALKPSGLVGSFVGALAVTVIWQRLIAPRRDTR